LLVLNQIWTFSTDFDEDPNIKFHGNLSSGIYTDIIRTDERTNGLMSLP